MAIQLKKHSNQLLTISEDSKLKLSDLKSYDLLADSSPTKSSLKSLLFDPDRDILLLGDSDGSLHLYSLLSNLLDYQVSLQLRSHSPIRSMCLSLGSFYLVAASLDGSLSILELGKPGKERFIK
jgi:WD40 repeat protein